MRFRLTVTITEVVGNLPYKALVGYICMYNQFDFRVSKDITQAYIFTDQHLANSIRNLCYNICLQKGLNYQIDVEAF